MKHSLREGVSLNTEWRKKECEGEKNEKELKDRPEECRQNRRQAFCPTCNNSNN